jgi:hypothetical protein
MTAHGRCPLVDDTGPDRIALWPASAPRRNSKCQDDTLPLVVCLAMQPWLLSERGLALAGARLGRHGPRRPRGRRPGAGAHVPGAGVGDDGRR